VRENWSPGDIARAHRYMRRQREEERTEFIYDMFWLLSTILAGKDADRIRHPSAVEVESLADSLILDAPTPAGPRRTYIRKNPDGTFTVPMQPRRISQEEKASILRSLHAAGRLTAEEVERAKADGVL
jgi:hypothetical protein